MPNSRLPIYEDVEPRLSTIDKDGLTTNAFYDKDEASQYVVKRPGMTSYIGASGEASGVYGWNNQTFQFYLPSVSWADLIHNGSTFLAISSENWSYEGDFAMKSVDGITWTQVFLPYGSDESSPKKYQAVAYNGTVYCAVGSSPIIATSPEGVTWTTRSITGMSNSAIATNGTNFVVVGTNNTYGTYSTDNGVTWNAASGLNANTYASVAYSSGAGVYCTVGNNSLGEIYTSPTGAVWTSRTSPAAVARRLIITDNTTFIATRNATTTTIDVSTDGITWSTRTLPVADNYFFGCYTGTLWVLGGGTYLLTSSNGTTWTSQAMPSTPDIDTSFYIVGGYNSTIILLPWTAWKPNFYKYSLDAGVTWTEGNLNTFYPIPIVV